MLFELLSIFTTLPFGFIPISCNNNSLASFLRTIRHTWHFDCLPWSVMQRQPRIGGEEEWLPCEKNIWQTKKVITTTELPDVFFPFFNVRFLWGEGFSKISNGRLYRWRFRSFESSFHCDDVRRNWHPYNPWSRSTRSRLVDQGREVKMVGDGNQWNLRLDYCEWENLECLFQRHFDVEAFGFLEVVFWYQLIWWCVFVGNSSTFWGSLNLHFVF